MNGTFPNSYINRNVIQSNVYKYSSDRYSQWFQTRIIHRILPANSLLSKMNLAETNTCSFCNRCEEAISHLFYECQNITPIWERVSKLVNDLVQPMSVNKQNALLGSNETNVKLDRLLLEEKKIFIQL